MTKLSPPRGNIQPVSRCCAPTCANSSDNTSGVSFFRFPKDEERCKKWVANCGRLDLQDKPAEKLFANYRLCSAHFQKASFSSTYRNRLVWNAVPTLFKHGDATVVSKGPSKRKPLPPGSQQKFRRFFGFASKRRTSVQLRPSSMVQPMATTYRKAEAGNHAAKTVEVATSEGEEQAAEGPRLPVYIEDHMYAAPTLHVIRSSMEGSSKQAPATKIFRLDPENNNRLVMDVVDGEDPAAVKAAMEAVEAALPLLQLSQQPPLHQGGAGGATPTITYVTMPASSAPPSVGDFAGMESVPAGTTFTVTVEDPPASELTLYLPPSSPNGEDGTEDDEYADDPFSPSLARSPPDRNRKGPRLMQDFLLPHLDSGTFGERLQWIDRQNGIFQIGWYHKSAAQWTNDDCVVFLEWDRLKKRPVAHSPQYWMEAKQRFRAALGKVSVAWVPPAGSAPFKNVKLRKIKFGKDVALPRTWKPRTAKPVSREGRCHRPTISRVERLDDVSPTAEMEEDEEEEEDADCGVNGGLAVCHKCGYTTRNQRVFLRHRMMHRDVRAFCCRYCPQRFCLPESLFLHLQVHTESYPYTCSSCGVRTRLLLQLWRHELRSLAQRLCFCHRCGLICHVRENLRTHLRKVHGVCVPAAFDTKPFEVCPGFHKPLKVADAKLKAPAKRGRPGKKASAAKPAEKAKAVGRPKAAKPKVERPKADDLKPKSVRPGTVKRKLGDAARPVGRPRGLKASAVKPKSPRLLAATKSKLDDAKSPSAKRFKGESVGDDTEGSKPGRNSLSNRTVKVQHGSTVKLEGFVISDAVSSELGSCDLPKSATHTARKSTPQATVPTIMAFPTSVGELTLNTSTAAAVPIEQGRRRTQRMRPPKRKVST